MRKIFSFAALLLFVLALSQCSLFQKYKIYIEIVGSGTVTRTPEMEEYPYEEEVVLAAKPDTAWRFNKWEGDIESANSQITVIMDSDKTLKVIFDEPPSYTLSGTWKSEDSNSSFNMVSGGISSSSTDRSVLSGGDTGPDGGILRTRSDLPDDASLLNNAPLPEPKGIIVKYKESAVHTSSFTPKRTVYGTERLLIDKNDRRLSVVEPPPGETMNVDAAVAYYNSLPGVEYAEPNPPVRLHAPNDTLYNSGYQWNLNQLDMSSVWDSVTGNSSVVVAVVDTGIDRNLEDFDTTSFTSGYDFVNNDSDPTDDDGHGSHVAGTIAQSTNNNLGVSGMAYGVTLMPVKSMPSGGSGYVSDIIKGIEYAVDNGADIINLSVGTTDYSSTFENACLNAYQQGVALFASAGNEDTSPVEYPAAFDMVIAVGSTGYDKNRAYYSNYGPALDIVAPGGDLTVDQNSDTYGDGILQNTITDAGYSDTPAAGYYYYQGTSMASPHVAALAALLLSKDSSYSVDELYDIIISTAEDLGASGRDNYYGYGLINPVAALGASITIHEINDTVTQQYDMSNLQDKYEIATYNGAISVNVEFEPEVCDINLYLYDSGGNLVDSSTSSTAERESVYYYVGFGGGTYTVEITGIP